MRQETNNEMDLLLRRLGRQQETSASSDHLDADELSLYAENVVPPAARARYTEHLAECARCRDLVVQLSSSAGVVVAQETAKVSAPSALRTFLGSLFSPMVLRYAVPALGLVIVAAIGLMVSQFDGPAGNAPVAEVREPQPARAPVPASQPQPSASPEKEPHLLFDDREPATKAVVPGKTAAESGAVAPSASTVSPVIADAQQETQAKKVEEETQRETKEAPAPKPTPTVAELKKLEIQGGRKQETEDRVAVANEPPAEKAKRDDRSVGDFAASTASSPKARAESSGAGVAPGAARPMAQQRDTEKNKDDADTRTVAGRRFRKQGNVWIDTAYNSQRLTELARGSEQYRGLVGDEPAIKQIADQLGGEIIVVWKGRAYRIH